MRAAVTAIVVGIAVTGSAIESFAYDPVPLDDAITTYTVDDTWACTKEADFDQYGMLVMNHHVGEAVLFLAEHQCVMLPANTPVKMDAAKGTQGSSHVCIRPRDSQYCLWTFKTHINLEFD
jgi:hypothetical protein